MRVYFEDEQIIGLLAHRCYQAIAAIGVLGGKQAYPVDAAYRSADGFDFHHESSWLSIS